MDSTPPTSPSTDAALAASAPPSVNGVLNATTESATIETRAVGTHVMGTQVGDESLASECDAGHTLKVVRFESLARCGDEIWIENEGQLYRLRKTRQGKLILTK